MLYWVRSYASSYPLIVTPEDTLSYISWLDICYYVSMILSTAIMTGLFWLVWPFISVQLPSKHDTLGGQYCNNVGPSSATMAQHYNNIGWTLHVCWVTGVRECGSSTHNADSNLYMELDMMQSGSQCYLIAGLKSQTCIFMVWVSEYCFTGIPWELHGIFLLLCSIWRKINAEQNKIGCYLFGTLKSLPDSWRSCPLTHTGIFKHVCDSQ